MTLHNSSATEQIKLKSSLIVYLSYIEIKTVMFLGLFMACSNDVIECNNQNNNDWISVSYEIIIQLNLL